MGYILKPKKKSAGDFEFGAFSFPVLLEVTNHLFACIHHGGKWYCDFAADPRMVIDSEKPNEYPKILSDGFEVTHEEAVIMARMAKNWVAIQRSLPESHENANKAIQNGVFKRDDLMDILSSAISNCSIEPEWPRKIRTDFVDKIEKFTEWAPKTGGFVIQ